MAPFASATWLPLSPALTEAEVSRQRAKEAESRQRRISQALAVWRDSLHAVGTAVETYLRSRAITVPPPPTLRFHPALKHRDGRTYPAIVAAVQAGDRSITGIHRTFLKVDGSEKADTLDCKLMLGICSGGAVRLATAGPVLGVCEGIETGLSAMQESDVPLWAALSTSGIKALMLPPLPVVKLRPTMTPPLKSLSALIRLANMRIRGGHLSRET